MFLLNIFLTQFRRNVVFNNSQRDIANVAVMDREIPVDNYYRYIIVQWYLHVFVTRITDMLSTECC